MKGEQTAIKYGKIIIETAVNSKARGGKWRKPQPALLYV